MSGSGWETRGGGESKKEVALRREREHKGDAQFNQVAAMAFYDTPGLFCSACQPRPPLRALGWRWRVGFTAALVALLPVSGFSFQVLVNFDSCAKPDADALRDLVKTPPFAFRYDGKPSAELLKDWKARRTSRRLDGQRTEHTVAWTDPKTGLVVRCAGIEYRDYPAVEWTVYFKNTGDRSTPILENIQGLDVTLRAGGGAEFLLRGNKGDSCGPANYEPFQTTLLPGAARRFAAAGGRPTNMDGWPYFNLQAPDGGLILAIGWPGQWAASFARDDRDGLRITAGQELTHLSLKPGEEVRTPLIALLFWKGTDAVQAQNLWRRWFLAHNAPRVKGQLPEPIIVGPGDMGDVGEAVFWEKINTLEQSDIAWNVCWIDAGWYRCERQWARTGTWEMDRELYPRGFKPLSDWLHQRGKKLIVWFEPERIGDPNSWLAKNHPEWLLSSLLDMGNPAARRWWTDYVDRTIVEEGIDIYRQDFNLEPLADWRRNDAPDRQGMTENLHVQGHLAFWDELRRRHPEIWIDCSASGGRRNDLETMRRSLPLRRSDYEGRAPDGRGGDTTVPMQAQTYALAAWLPFYGVFGVVDGPYHTRSCYSPSFGTWVPKALEMDEAKRVEVKRAFEEVARVGPFMLGDYYPLTPYSLTNNAWIAWQFDRPDLRGGVVQAFRRASCARDSIQVKLRGVKPKARYELVDFDAAGVTERSGRDLLENGITITIKEQPGSAILIYSRK